MPIQISVRRDHFSVPERSIFSHLKLDSVVRACYNLGRLQNQIFDELKIKQFRIDWTWRDVVTPQTSYKSTANGELDISLFFASPVICCLQMREEL